MIYNKKKNTIWKIIRKFSNLNASIILLLLIASISILGTVIEQDQAVNYYQLNYPINPNLMRIINWQFILFCGLDHIYRTWWFLFLLVLFVCTLVACTFSRQLPSLRNARNWKFSKYNHTIQCRPKFIFSHLKLLSNIVYELNVKYYYVFHKSNSLYAYKGLAGRIAPIIVHISIIVTLLGSMIGLFGGFTGQQIITKGEIFHIQNVIKSGISSYLPVNVIGRIEDFTIEYYSDDSIKQFFSSVSLSNRKGETIKKQTISVNHPLVFRGVTFYQTDWKINALRMNINDVYDVQQPLEKIKLENLNLWIYKMPLGIDQYIFIVITGTKNNILLYNYLGQFINSVNINEKFTINNCNVVFKEIMTQTGIQIKTDPGIIYIYTGFLTLMLSIIISYQSYYQLWIHENNQNLQVRGVTNRAQLTFEEELVNIQKKILEYT